MWFARVARTNIRLWSAQHHLDTLNIDADFAPLAKVCAVLVTMCVHVPRTFHEYLNVKDRGTRLAQVGAIAVAKMPK
jgi:hypothetical protein